MTRPSSTHIELLTSELFAHALQLLGKEGVAQR